MFKKISLVVLVLAIWMGISLSNADTDYKEELITIETSAKLLNSTVKIITENDTHTGHGTGFYIDRNIILTNYHVIEKKNKISILTYKKRTCDAEVIKSDMKNDMALIKTNCFGVPLEINGNYSIGQTVLTVGNPLIYDFTVAMGIVSGERFGFIQYDALVTTGSSGSAIVNIEGQVIGMAVTQDDEKDFFNFAIPSDKILELIK